jgi:hypothetical protein
MIDYLLSIASHPAFLDPKTQSLLIESLYSKKHNKTRTFKHSIQSLISSIVDLGHFELAAGLLNLLTTSSINHQIKQHSLSSSNISSFPLKVVQTSPLTQDTPFEYIPNKLLRLNSDYTFYKNADLVALIFITIYHHPTISRKDLERLSQKYISLFSSLSDSNAWDSRYSNRRTRFTILSSEVLRYATKINYIESVKVDDKSIYALTNLGLALCDTIFITLPSNLTLATQ